MHRVQLCLDISMQYRCRFCLLARQLRVDTVGWRAHGKMRQQQQLGICACGSRHRYGFYNVVPARHADLESAHVYEKEGWRFDDV